MYIEFQLLRLFVHEKLIHKSWETLFSRFLYAEGFENLCRARNFSTVVIVRKSFPSYHVFLENLAELGSK